MKLHISGLGNLSILLDILTILFLVTTYVVTFAPLQGCLPKCVGDRIHARVISGTLQMSSLRRVLGGRGLCVVGVRSVFDKGITVSDIRALSSLATTHRSALVRHAGHRRRFHHRCRRGRGCGLAAIASRPSIGKLVLCHPAHKVISSRFGTRGGRFKASVTTGPGRDILTAVSKAIVLDACATRANCLVNMRRGRSLVSVCGRYNSLLGGRNRHIGNNRTVTLINGDNALDANPRLRFRL